MVIHVSVLVYWKENEKLSDRDPNGLIDHEKEENKTATEVIMRLNVCYFFYRLVKDEKRWILL